MSEYDKILNTLNTILENLNHIHSDIAKFDEKYLRSESWEIYHSMINKDLNNLGCKIREFEETIKNITNINQRQDIAFTKLSTKVATILGIIGGLSGVGAIIAYLIRTWSGIG